IDPNCALTRMVKKLMVRFPESERHSSLPSEACQTVSRDDETDFDSVPVPVAPASERTHFPRSPQIFLNHQPKGTLAANERDQASSDEVVDKATHGSLSYRL